MIRGLLILIVALGVACGSSKSADRAAAPAAKRTYKVTALGAYAPITVELAVPAKWTEGEADLAGPQFKIPGTDTMLLGLAALGLTGDTPAERVAKAIKAQYGDAQDAVRTELSGGRVWVVQTEPVVHARMFVPFADGVLMGVAILPPRSADHLPAIRAAFDTLAIVGAPPSSP